MTKYKRRDWLITEETAVVLWHQEGRSPKWMAEQLNRSYQSLKGKLQELGQEELLARIPREKKVEFFLTEAEFRSLSRKAQHEGMFRAGFIRKLIKEAVVASDG